MFFATCLITCNHVLALNATSLLAMTCLCKNQAGGHFGILTGINVEFFSAITMHAQGNQLWKATCQNSACVLRTQ